MNGQISRENWQIRQDLSFHWFMSNMRRKAILRAGKRLAVYHHVMANHQDAEITEIVVVISRASENYMNEAVERLRAVGVEIFSTDEENDVVEGAIESSKIVEIEKIPGVNYVRTVSTYIADYPAGDPRDKDGVEEDDD
jgi:FlaA1/EpsC-like NDP-sugar epimerase